MRISDWSSDVCSSDLRIREVVPDAKLVYNNSPSFNWTLNFRQQVYDRWAKEGKDVSGFERDALMSVIYDNTELAAEADEKIRTFQADAAKRAGIFHHLRSEEHTSELQSLMRISYAVFCLKKKIQTKTTKANQ